MVPAIGGIEGIRSIVDGGGDDDRRICAGPLAGGRFLGGFGEDGVGVGSVGGLDGRELARVDGVGAAPGQAFHAMTRIVGAEGAAEDPIDPKDELGDGVVGEAAVVVCEGQPVDALEDVGLGGGSCGVGRVGHDG